MSEGRVRNLDLPLTLTAATAAALSGLGDVTITAYREYPDGAEPILEDGRTVDREGNVSES